MALTTILVDPQKNYETVPSSAQLAADFNRDNPDHLQMSEQDIDDLHEMLVDAGILEEHTYQ